MDSCFLPTIGKRHTDKVLLLDHIGLDQKFVDNILGQYSRLRDFYNHPPYVGPMIHHAGFVADAINASLISIQSVAKQCPPNIRRNIPTFHNLQFGVNLQNLYNEIRKIHGNLEHPVATQRYFNF